MKRVLAAIVVGVGVGMILLASQGPSYSFLPGARMVGRDRSRLSSEFQVFSFRYQASEEVSRVLSRVRRAYPHRTESAQSAGIVVQVPRTRAQGGFDMTFPPAREIVITDGDPAAVMVKEYRPTGPIDTLVEWMGRGFHA